MDGEAQKEPGNTGDTLILSDLHLGSGLSRAADALHLLKHRDLLPTDPAGRYLRGPETSDG